MNEHVSPPDAERPVSGDRKAETAVIEHRRANAIETSPDTLMAVISRAASDPTVNVDKLERLMALYERAEARNAKVAYAQALAAMQPKLPVIGRKGAIVVPGKSGAEDRRTPYALWEDINEAIRPHLAEHGFALSFRVGLAQDGKITVTGVLSHREGHSEETTITLPHDSSGAKNAVQAVGSSTAYGKRYTAMAILNITSRGEDDDGKIGGAMQEEPLVSEEQIAKIRDALKFKGKDETKFLAYVKIESLADMKASKFDDALKIIQGR